MKLYLVAISYLFFKQIQQDDVVVNVRASSVVYRGFKWAGFIKDQHFIAE